MGVDARWLCHTCKTMCCADGARSYLNYNIKLEDATGFLGYLDRAYKKVFSIYGDSFPDSLEVRSLRNYIRWARRHKGHDITLTNDSSVGRDDYPDYRAETVDGTVSKITFGEELDAQAKMYMEDYCPNCGSYVGDLSVSDRQRITGVVKEGE